MDTGMSEKPNRRHPPCGDDDEPRIVVFACNWCSYAGADFAGVGRMQYPATIRIIRVMCSGRVHPAFVLKAFEAGADGVMVSGCHPGDCHYAFGNLRARENIEMTEQLLHLLGIEPERFRLEWFTAAEGAKFARVLTEFAEGVKRVGKSPYRTKLSEHMAETAYGTDEWPSGEPELIGSRMNV